MSERPVTVTVLEVPPKGQAGLESPHVRALCDVLVEILRNRKGASQ